MTAKLKFTIKPRELSVNSSNQSFPKMGSSDLQTMECVSGKVQSNAKKEVAKTAISVNVRSFIQILIDRLNKEKFPRQVVLIKKIFSKCVECQDTTPSQALREGTLHIKRELINVIKTLDFDEINNLKIQFTKLPQLMVDIFKLSKIEKQIEENSLVKDKSLKDRNLWKIVRALIDTGNIERAFDVAMMIPRFNSKKIDKDSLNKERDAMHNVHGFLMRGEIKKAIHVWLEITHKGIRKIAFLDISYTIQKKRVADLSKANSLSVDLNSQMDNLHELNRKIARFSAESARLVAQSARLPAQSTYPSPESRVDQIGKLYRRIDHLSIQSASCLARHASLKQKITRLQIQTLELQERGDYWHGLQLSLNSAFLG